MTPNEQLFIDGLNKLTRNLGVAVQGCGCCGSPSLKVLDYTVNKKGAYRYTEEFDGVEYLVWSQEEYECDS